MGDKFCVGRLYVSTFIFCHSGKTLILEEAAQTLAQMENTRVVFIMALGGWDSVKCVY